MLCCDMKMLDLSEVPGISFSVMQIVTLEQLRNSRGRVNETLNPELYRSYASSRKMKQNLV